MRVLVRPAYAFFLRNALFQPKYDLASHWLEPFVRLRARAADLGIQIDTWDMHPPESADVILFQDPPPARREVLAARARSPRAIFILQLWESSLGRPHFFVPENHRDFDAILTYNPRLCDERRYFHYQLPIGVPEPVGDTPFADRRPLVLLNTNRSIGIWGPRQPGLSGIPFFGPLFGGYKVRIGEFLLQNQGELYSRRREFVKLAERIAPDVLDVYGAGWRGELMGWHHRIVPNRKYKLARGELKGEKTPLLAKYRFVLAFENMRGDVGYISEKIFDAFFAGAVPIYLGDERIAEHVPPEAFVDARKFKNDSDLLAFARDCGEAEWRAMRDAGKAFASGPSMYKFSADGFASRMIEVLSAVGSRGRGETLAPAGSTGDAGR